MTLPEIPYQKWKNNPLTDSSFGLVEAFGTAAVGIVLTALIKWAWDYLKQKRKRRGS